MPTQNILRVATSIGVGLLSLSALCAPPETVYDMEMAQELCRQLPLESVEGIWLYPDDKVTVLILKDSEASQQNVFPSYTISVVATDDAALNPTDVIGKLYATAEDNVFKIELSTEKRNDLLLKPKACTATLSKDADSFILKKQKTPFKGRLNLNFNRLLPGFWKIVSTGISASGNSSSVNPPVGMIKIFPSYDGNGSSRRQIRYL